MDRGSYQRLVSIQRLDPAAGRDAAGHPVKTWVEVTKAWANILGQSGRQVAEANGVVSAVRSSIRVPYRQDLDATMRVVLGATVFTIIAVLPDERTRDYVDLVCESGARQG